MDCDGRLMEVFNLLQVLQKWCGISSWVVPRLLEVTGANQWLKVAVLGYFQLFYPYTACQDHFGQATRSCWMHLEAS